MFQYWGIIEFLDIGATDDIFMENYQYDSLVEYYDELEELETTLDEYEDFDEDDYIVGFEEMLDEEGDILVSGITFYPSDILKNCDPIAYDCSFSDYVSTYKDEYDNLKNDYEESISEKEQEIQDILEDITQITE